MARLVQGIRDAPEDGAGRVVALRQSIAAGSYRIPASAVAEKLTAAMLVEGERLRSEQVDDRRDRVLEQQVQQQTQTQSQSAMVESAMQQVESIFNLSATTTTASSTPLGAANDAFFGALSTLANSPSSTAARQNVLSAATALASQFNTAASQVAQINSGLNQQVSSAVKAVNGLTATIAVAERGDCKREPEG